MYTFSELLTDLAVAKAFSPDLDTVGQKAVVNEAIERLILSGRWLGTQQKIAVHVDSTGVLTLPRHYLTLLGVRVNGESRDLTSKWWTFLQYSTATNQFGFDNVQDEGIGFAIFADPTEAVQLKISTTTSETDTVRVQGEDEDGDTIYTSSDGSSGFNLTLNDANWSTQSVTTISAVEMPVTNSPKTLTALYDDDVTTQVLGVYEPGETNPFYRRYLVSEATLLSDPASVEAICQLQFTKLVSDSDVVRPSHLGAIKNACLHVHYENEGEEERSAFHFETALKLLNAQLRRSIPESEIGAVRIRCVGNPIGSNLRSTY